MSDTSPRKLAVIMHADVVDSTRLVRKDETLAHDRIKDAFARFSETIESYGGTAHEIRGDALVAEFSRASDAICAAVVFQGNNTAFNDNLEDELRPRLRVGIAMGEVVIADNTITGDGVVLAQRLEQLSEPEGICIQGAVYETVPKRFPFDYEHIGERTLKGFDETVRCYLVRLTTGGVVPPAESKAPELRSVKSTENPSIAVLPFMNMSGDPEQEYFADGMTEDIIAALSQLSDLVVVDRHSSFAYKGVKAGIRDIAAQLTVRYILEGSVRKMGNRGRITAQLIDSVSGTTLWSDRYDRELDDIFSIQDEITRAIAVALHAELSFGGHARIWQGGTLSFEAWQSQVRGVQRFFKFTFDGRVDARAAFQQVLEIEPTYYPALTALGHTYYQSARYQDNADPRVDLEKAREISERLLALEGCEPNGYALLANVRFTEGRHDEALDACKRAVQLEPDSPDHQGRYAHLLMYAGEFRMALHHLNTSFQISSHHPNWFTTTEVLAHFFLDELDAAQRAAERALQRFPDFPHAHINLASVYAARGMDAKANKVAEKFLASQPLFSVRHYAKSQIFRDPAHARTWTDCMLRSGLAA